MPSSISPMLIVIHSGPSIDRRYRSTTSYHANVHHNSALRVPLHQSPHAAETVRAEFSWRWAEFMIGRGAVGGR